MPTKKTDSGTTAKMNLLDRYMNSMRVLKHFGLPLGRRRDGSLVVRNRFALCIVLSFGIAKG